MRTTRSPFVSPFAAAAFLTLAVLPFACTTGDDPETTLDAGSEAGIDGEFFTDTGKPDCGAALRCAPDLRSVIDCSGQVVTACPSDQACSPELKCVPACEATAASKSSMGCAFAGVVPELYDPQQPPGKRSLTRGDCYAVFVVNAWDAPVKLSVTYGGAPLEDIPRFARLPEGSGKKLEYVPMTSDTLDAGQVAILFLAGQSDAPVKCPAGVVPAVQDDAAWGLGTRLRKAFRVETSLPVAAYDIYPYGGGISAVTGASLLLPAGSWGKQYLGITAYDAKPSPDIFANGATEEDLAPWLLVIADQDDTHVTIAPHVNLVAGQGVAAIAANTTGVVTLQRGQALQLAQPTDLLGTPITADKPIAVQGGARCMNIPENKVACDAAHQQLAPLEALGSEYVAAKPRDRYFGVTDVAPWRIIAAADGTKLTYTPRKPFGAPDTLDAGQMIQFNEAEPFVVRSQDADHPFYLAQYMTSCQQASEDSYGSDCRGDPEFVVTVPSSQFMSKYAFFTDPTYPETNLVLVRTSGPDGFYPVRLDCAGEVQGWQPILGTPYEYTRLDLVRHAWEPQGGCDNGRHTIESEAPFGVTVWGWGSVESGSGSLGDPDYSQAVSYAYPVGGFARSLTSIPPK